MKLNRILLFGILLLPVLPVFAQRSKRIEQPIIDVHLHAYSSDLRWNARTQNGHRYIP